MPNKASSNAALLDTLDKALMQEHASLASIIEILIEVEDRRLHLELACSSMYTFCVRRLGLSEDQAYRRSAAAEIARKYPQALIALRERRIRLTGLVLLRDVLTKENVDNLLSRAAGKTKRDIQELVASLAPKPDIHSSIRAYPNTAARPDTTSAPTMGLFAGAGAGAGTAATALIATAHSPAPGMQMRDSAAASASTSATATTMLMTAGATSEPPRIAATREPARTAAGPQLSVSSPGRHKVQFTASTALRKKLERAQALMRHRNIDGDLAVVVERAIDLLLTKIERAKFGISKNPRTTPKARAKARTDARISTSSSTPASAAMKREPSSNVGPAAIPAVARREVAVRDDQCCAFVSADGAMRRAGPARARPPEASSSRRTQRSLEPAPLLPGSQPSRCREGLRQRAHATRHPGRTRPPRQPPHSNVGRRSHAPHADLRTCVALVRAPRQRGGTKPSPPSTRSHDT